MYANELAPAISEPEAWPGDGGGGGGSMMGGTDCSLMVYRAASRMEDGAVVAVGAVGPSGGVGAMGQVTSGKWGVTWAAQCIRYAYPHASRLAHSPFASLCHFGEDLASGWASCLAGHIHLCLTVGQGPVVSEGMVAPLPVVVVAAGAGSGSDWTQSSGMGSGHQLQLKKKRKTSGLTG